LPGGFQAKKDELFNSLEKMVSSNLNTLRELQSSGLSQEEIKTEFAKFQQSFEAMAMELEPEFNRVDTIPGISQFADSIKDEFLKRLEPMAAEGEQLMNELRGEDTSGISSSIAAIPPKKIERQKLNELDTLYNIRSIDELKTFKDLIIDTIGDRLRNDLIRLQGFKKRNIPKGEYMGDFQEIEKHLDIFGNEVECEFKRLETLPNGAEYVKIFQEELVNRLRTILDEIDELIDELK